MFHRRGPVNKLLRAEARRVRFTSDEIAALAILGTVALAMLLDLTPVSVLAIVLLLAIAARFPGVSIAVIPAVIGFVYQDIAFGNARFSPQEILLVATIGGVGLNVVWRFIRQPSLERILKILRTIPGHIHPFDALALLFVVIGTLSLFTVAMPAYRHESLRVYRWVILEPIIYYALARYYLQTRHTRRMAVAAFAGGALLVAAIGLIDLAIGRGLQVEGVTRISGVYPHPNALALFLERPFILLIGLAAVFRNRMSWRWLLPATVVGLALLLTFSRGAVLAAALVIILLLVIGQRRRLAASAAAAGLVLLAVLAFTASARIDNLFSGGSGSLRIALWKSAWQMIRDHPIFGIGLDQFLYVYAPRYVRPEAWSERFTSHPHNILLDSWLSLGIMGLVLALVFVVILLISMLQLTRKRSALGLAAAAAIMTGLLHGLVDNGYFLPDLALIFWLLTAFMVVEMHDGVDLNRQKR